MKIAYLKYLLVFFIAVISHKYVYSITADDILTQATIKYNNAKSISAQFSINSGGKSTKGLITMSGDKFHMATPQLTIWYNGRTQWTYSDDTQEVNITEPTPDELQQVNPFAIINSFCKQYNAQLTNSANGIYSIKLSPRINTNTAIKGVNICLNTSTLYPTEIELTLDNNSIILINVLNVTIGKTLPISTFTFDKSKYPDAEIVDLR